MEMVFVRYEVQDDGVTLEFLAPDPGPGRLTAYSIFVTDAELAATTTSPQLRTLVTAKLQRKVQATNIASKLDGFIGQSVTI